MIHRQWLQTTEGQGHCAVVSVDTALVQRCDSSPAGAGEFKGRSRTSSCAVDCPGSVIHVAGGAMLAHLLERVPEWS